MFGVKPTKHQEDLLYAASKPGARVSVRSGHGTGKTTALAWLILWFVIFHDDVKVPCTAPTASQLCAGLWPEIGKWHSKFKYKPFADMIVINADKIYIKDFAMSRFAIARTASKDKPESLQGIRATNLMVIIDEASGVDDKVFEVAESTLSTPGARIIMCSNPTISNLLSGRKTKSTLFIFPSSILPVNTKPLPVTLKASSKLNNAIF